MALAPDNVIHVRASRAEVRRLIYQLPAIVTGRSGDAQDLARTMLVRMGLVALGHIKKAFIQKAAGGEDETGLRWKPLSKKTVAYGRKHPGVPPKRVRAKDRPSWALSKAQRNRWWTLYRRGLARYRGDKSHAAAMAWFVVKQEGAITLLDLHGNETVLILRDKGLLLNSLSPGSDVSSAGPEPPKVKNQVFRLGPGEVVIGTNREGARAHHYGFPGRTPQRRLWPDPERWPAHWWDGMLEAGQQSLVEIVTYLLTQRG